MLDYFVIPVNFNDVEHPSESFNRHQVLNVDLDLNEREMIKKLKSIDFAISGQYEAITSAKVFDFLYHLIKSFGENIEFKSMKVLEELAQTVHFILQQFIKIATKVTVNSDMAANFRVPFKMAIFTALFFISNTVLKKVRQQYDIMTDALREKGKRRVKNEQFEVSQSVMKYQVAIVEQLRQSINLNFVAIWQQKEVDAEFFKKYIDICVKILQSNLVKNQQVSRLIFEMLEYILGANSSQGICNNFQTILANLVYQGDIIDNLVQFFSKAQGPQLQKLCTEALTLVVIFLTNKQNLNAQSQSIKNTREFLSKLSQKIPKVFYTNLSCFITLFQHESYHLRNAISDILMNILLFSLSGDSQDNYKEPKQKFITTLLQRIYDKSSFCRGHVLSILAQLTAQKIVPHKFLILFMKAGIDRIKDQSINTRRKAIQLINIVIDSLCQSEMIPSQQIQKQLEMAELQLQSLAAQQQRLKRTIEQIDDDDQLQQLLTETKIVKKRLKTLQQLELVLYQKKQFNFLAEKVIDHLRILLGSKTETDVLETIKLFMKLHKLQFKRAAQALQDIRLLIFSKQKKIKDQVLSCFVSLHLTARSQQVAKELINLFTAATLQDISALEEILETIIIESKAKDLIIIKPHTFAHLWNQFVQNQRTGQNIPQKRAIITIMRISFSKNSALVKPENIESFLNILKSYIQNNQPDYHILIQISKIVILNYPIIVKSTKHFLISQIFILVNTSGTNQNQWYAAAEAVLNCIFTVCDSPQKLSDIFIRKLHDKLQKNKQVKCLSQFIHALAHNCLKCLIYLDRMQNKIKSNKQQSVNEELEGEEQLQKVMGGMEAELERQIQRIQKLAQSILDDPFISRWVSFVEKIVINFKQGTQLEIISILAYCKFMCLSSSFCEARFSQLLKLLNSPNINSVVKNNLIISFGDLLHRFPNIIEPYNKYLYQNLHDNDPKVRKTTLTVITHLCLNDMIKAKSDMCDVALLFQDPDIQISSLVKQFFHDMNKKDPRNMFALIPQALVRFSNLDLNQNEQTFKVFLENVIPLLEKDKYSQSLVIKLCQRLANSLNLLELKNTAHCLSQINLNEKGIRRIIENFQSFKKVLENPEISTMFKSIVTKLKKAQKNQLKGLIDELEEKITHSNQDIFNVQEIKKRNMQRENKKQPKKKLKTASKRGRPRTNLDEDDESNEMDIEEQPTSQKQSTRVRTQRSTQRRMRVIDQSQQQQQQDEYQISQ